MNSPAVRSRQLEPSGHLEQRLQRYVRQPFGGHLHAPTCEAFARLCALLEPAEFQHLILDSGCGTGASSRLLASQYPDCVVIGIDRSAKRLLKSGAGALPRRRGNLVLVRAELSSFWRLANAAGWRLERHFLLYPNPWPKHRHLKKRWHAHPVFPIALALGGKWDMRCNWRVYAEEFAQAVRFCTEAPVTLETLQADRPLSPFETKYAASGHTLYRVRFEITGPDPGSIGQYR